VGWYFRKSVGFGPFRLNLSKSGIGYSFGVRGARIGTGPHGNYVRLGRDGVYYQKYAGGGSRTSKEATDIRSASGQAVPEVDPSELLDTDAADLLKEIRDTRARTSWAPLFAISAVGALLIDLSFSSQPLQGFVLGIAALVVWIQLRKVDQARKTVRLTYTLDSNAKTRYEALLRAVRSLGSCAAIWRVTSEQSAANPKYSSGASYTVERTTVSYRQTPPMIQVNLKVAGLDLGDQSVWFLPDRALVWSTGGVGAVEYPAISCKSTPIAFVEAGPLPSDTQVLHTRWRHANRDGGPDRRFAHNSQVPVVRYAELNVASATGMFFLLHASSPEKAALFCEGLLAYGAAGRNEAGEPRRPAAHSHQGSSQGPAVADDDARNSNAQSGSSGRPGGQHVEAHDEEANATVIRRVLQALEAGNLNLLRAKAPMPLDAGEVCRVSVEGCAYVAGAYSSKPRSDIGSLYLTNERLRYVGKKMSVELMMRKVLSCSLNPEISSVARVVAAMMKTALQSTETPGVVQVVSVMGPTLMHLSGRTALINELIVAAITKISAAAKQGSSEPKHASGGQTGSAAGERVDRNRTQSPWEVLHVSPGASADEIAAAYRKIAQLYHPDKVAALGPELREVAEQKMKEINAAYDSLRTNRGA
jgi:Protein of unknown function (DUF4236)/DnaJ domain